MLGLILYIVLIIIIYLSIKLSFLLSRHKSAFEKYGVESQKIIFLQFASLLYSLSLLDYILPFSELDLFRPIPFGLLILLPGIILGKKVSEKMQISGVTDGVNAGQVANNIMWLGIGTGIFIMANIIFSFLFDI